MGEIAKKLLQTVFTVFPTIFMLCLTVSIGCVVISLNPDVTWNEFKAEDLYGISGMKSKYTSNLWSSVDPTHFDSSSSGGKYTEILSKNRDETWKEAIRFDLTKAVGIISGSLFLLLSALAIHVVTKQKLFVIIADILACGSGITGGYFCMQALSNYKKSLINMMTTVAAGPGGFYDSDKDQMKLGYLLAQYGAYVAFVTCFLVLVNCGLYIPYGEGKWIWQKKVAPAEDSKPPIVKTQ